MWSVLCLCAYDQPNKKKSDFLSLKLCANFCSAVDAADLRKTTTAAAAVINLIYRLICVD